MTEVERRSKQFWAPESLLSRRYGKSSDIFCLGAIFYYVLTDGKYPFTINKVVEDFGDEKINKYFLHEDMSHIFKLDETADKYLGIDLISEMVQNDRRSRPQSVEVPKHPFLWTLLEKRTFVLKFYENLEKKKDQIIDILNINSEHIIQNDWINPLEVPLKNDVTVKKNGVCNYNKEIIWHLIRFMRNKVRKTSIFLKRFCIGILIFYLRRLILKLTLL